MSTPEERFDRDISEEHRDDVLTRISLAVSGYPHNEQDDSITILDHDRYDAINARGQGIIEFNGVEYLFTVEAGNWNGTVIDEWEGDKAFEPYHRTKWSLEPRADLVASAVASGRGDFLVAKWDALLARAEVAKIPGDYTYDRMMQPGGFIEGHYRQQAAKYGFVIVPEEEAAATRARLLVAATTDNSKARSA